MVDFCPGGGTTHRGKHMMSTHTCMYADALKGHYVVLEKKFKLRMVIITILMR